MKQKGHCHCGETHWEFIDPEPSSYYCHCGDCRRNCAAPVAAWISVKDDHFKWTKKMPQCRTTPQGTRRYFCATCGTPMAFEADHYPGSISLYAATLENPEKFEPTFHVHFRSKLSWLGIEDDLPKYAGGRLDQEG